MTIWDQPSVDWTSGEGLSALQLFERAYSDQDAIRDLAASVDVNLTPGPASVRELWIALLNEAAATDRVLDVAAELLEDADRVWFTTPLSALLGTQLPFANARRIRRHGLPDDETIRRAVVESLVDEAGDESALLQALPVVRPDVEPEDRAAGLQSISVPQAGIDTAISAVRAIQDAVRRVALVRRHGIHKGTGFLIGPDLLLTAAHVVAQYPAAAGVDGLDVVFDLHEGGGRSMAETGVGVAVAAILDQSPPTDDEIGGRALLQSDAPADKLDFALLQLARRVGDDPTPDTKRRGFYRLELTPYDLSMAPPTELFHHPLGGFLGWSSVLGGFTTNSSKTRIRYKSNTLVGSSGGAIIDRRGRLVAMHHYSTNASQNQAVPIWLIATALANGQASARLAAVAAVAGELSAAPPPVAPLAAAVVPDPFAALRVGPRPMVNRQPLRDSLKAMVPNAGRRRLKIAGSSDTGVSWSLWLLRHVEANALLVPDLRSSCPSGWRVIDVDLRTLIKVSVEQSSDKLVQQIYSQLPGGGGGASIAQAARDATEFKRVFREAIRGTDIQWWVFVDSLDEIADIEVRGINEIVYALIDLTEENLPLRLVLAGRQVDRFEHPSLGWAASDETTGLRREEVRSWITDRVVEGGGTVVDVQVDDFLNTWFADADVAREPERLALALEDAVRKATS